MRDDADDIDFNRFFRFQFTQVMFDWAVEEEVFSEGKLTPCTSEILDATDRQREIMRLEKFQCADLKANKHIVQGQWASVLTHYPSF